ncbi:VWA domain-containing protein [Vibrio sp. McD22-P3]|uniref:VWA domain-containing protein n=1 Tax=Vibrio sp. McD22-P3 TaxID=2724880 RepID=UPI001F43E820|nr:VWA domain-containing protein [Vibrio sp. McD22-P3]MCF4176832.1 VWA domain-containing protein [Vibrio sp. McD22-P3]
MLTFTYPWFGLLVLLPVIMLATPKHLTRQTALRFSHFDKFIEVTGSTPRSGAVVIRPSWWQRSLTMLTFLGLVLAATKPVWVGEPIAIEKSGREMMVAVDLSGSMEAKDFVDQQGINVRRIDGVKLLLESFLQQRTGDRVGLIAFGDDAYLQAPVTEDFDTLSLLLEQMDVRMAGAGTALGDAIGVAVNHFEHSESNNKVLLLLTDGKDTTSQFPPVDAAHFAGERGITIYPIAIGDATNVGEEAIDLEMLARIASYTGGQVFEALDGDALAAVYQTLNELEASLFESYVIRPKFEVYFWPLFFITILNLLALTFVATRTLHHTRKGVNNG